MSNFGHFSVSETHLAPSDCADGDSPLHPSCHTRKAEPLHPTLPRILSKAASQTPRTGLWTPSLPSPCWSHSATAPLCRASSQQGRAGQPCPQNVQSSILCRAHTHTHTHSLLPQQPPCSMSRMQHKVLMLSSEAAGSWDHPPLAEKGNRKAPPKRAQGIKLSTSGSYHLPV